MRVCPQCASIYTKGRETCVLDGTGLIEQDEDPLVGRPLDRYVIEERLGVGGMGCVYRARHEVLEREYAIKVLYGDFADDERFRARFRREAQSISRIQHQNVVHVEDFGTSSAGLTFLAMELVRGATLEDLIQREAPFSPARAGRLMRQIAEGLGAAHERELVHRDVKPSNIMVTGDPETEEVKILDFGAVNLQMPESDARLTHVGHIIGTPTYMAPEQCHDPNVGPPADLYALGVVTFEMLTGEPPFYSEVRTEILIKHISEPPPPLPEAAGLEHMVNWLLRKHPEERPSSAKALIEQLNNLHILGGKADDAQTHPDLPPVVVNTARVETVSTPSEPAPTPPDRTPGADQTDPTPMSELPQMAPTPTAPTMAVQPEPTEIVRERVTSSPEPLMSPPLNLEPPSMGLEAIDADPTNVESEEIEPSDSVEKTRLSPIAEELALVVRPKINGAMGDHDTDDVNQATENDAQTLLDADAPASWPPTPSREVTPVSTRNPEVPLKAPMSFVGEAIDPASQGPAPLSTPDIRLTSNTDFERETDPESGTLDRPTAPMSPSAGPMNGETRASPTMPLRTLSTEAPRPARKTTLYVLYGLILFATALLVWILAQRFMIRDVETIPASSKPGVVDVNTPPS